MKHKPLGQVLVQRGVIPPVKLREALELQRRSGNRLATECHIQRFASEEDLLACLSDQIGVPGIHMSNLVLPLPALDLIPEAVALKQLVLPVRLDADRLFLALADPTDSALISEVAFLSNRQVVACVALQGLLRQTITNAYLAKKRGELDYRGEHATEADASLVPLSLVYPRELTRVPQELLHPPETAAPPLTLPSGGATPQGGDDVVIPIEEGAATHDIIVPFEDDDFHIAITIPVEPATVPTMSSGEVALPKGPATAPHAGSGVRAPRVGAGAPRSPTPVRGGSARDPHPSSAPPRVLIVDDDAELRRLVTRVLQSHGLDVTQASRGLEALALIKSAPPDLVLLDAMLPEIHGFDICRKIKSSDRYGNIPVIMISSVYRGWRFARDLKDTYGVEAFLEKPFGIDALWSAVERVLAGRARIQRNSSDMVARTNDAYQQAIRCFRENDLDGAIQHCLDGIRIDPLSARLHFRLGVFYLKKKEMIYQALREMEEAVTLDPDLFSAQRILAILYQRRGFKNKAIDMWERALRSSPNDEAREKIRNHLKNLL